MAFVAPYPCFGCGFLGVTLCDDCKYDIIKQPRLTDIRQLVGLTPYIDRIEVAGRYEGLIKTIIHAYKFENVKGMARPMAALLAPSIPKNAIVVPVPTSRRHIRQRGYDHTALIVRYLGLPVFTGIKRIDQRAQVNATKSQRTEQAQVAYQITSLPDPTATYVIVDDVITTGETVKNIARLLHDKGVTCIKVVAIAHQPLD